MTKIPIAKPCFGEEEKRAVVEPLENGWVVQGPKVAEFESRFAEYTGAPFALATTSATTALHVALVALGVGPGDEVIVPSFTWVASANVVEMLGAKPVFVDIDLVTFNIDVNQIERAITKRTKVIMPVSLFGVSADMDAVNLIARKYSLRVVEDAACAVGARYRGHHAGTLADIACFSFHPRKVISTGEGGMLITGSSEIAERVKALRDHGASKSDLARHLGSRSYLLPEFNVAGFNYRMTDFQGAIGVVQVQRLPSLMEQRRLLAARYDDAFRSLAWLRTPVTPHGSVHGYQAYVCLFRPEDPDVRRVDSLHERRNAWMDALEAEGVATRPGCHAVHLLGYYRQKYSINPTDFPNALLADRTTIALPLFAQLTESEQQHVIDCVLRAKAR